jgi:hypothetical protein
MRPKAVVRLSEKVFIRSGELKPQPAPHAYVKSPYEQRCIRAEVEALPVLGHTADHAKD